MKILPFQVPWHLSLKAVPTIAGLWTCLVAVLVLLGWWLQVALATVPSPRYPVLMPTAAFGFVLAGLALCLAQRAVKSLPRRSSLVLALLAASIGTLQLCQYALGFSNSVDQWLAFPSAEIALTHVSFHTGLLLLLIGLAIFLLDFVPRRGPQPAQLLAICAGCIAIIALVGYFVQNPAFYFLNRSYDAGLSMAGALLSGLLVVGILAARPSMGFAAIALSKSGAGVLARRLLLFPVLVPLVTSLASTAGQRNGLITKEFAGWIYPYAYLLVFTLIIWWVASVVQQGEDERAEQERRYRAVAETATRLNGELVQANKELEAFSYSVSHDLRAPLRAIDGFSRILLEECATALEGEYKAYLQDIRQNAQQMGQLIDALLSFAKLSRQPLKRNAVAMDELVKECLEYLTDDDSANRPELILHELPSCHADRSLMKQVWQNLIDNALKYSKVREPAVIEIGSQPPHNGAGCIYYVRDNGAGFDMKYASKLFGVFQRLHRMEEFPGTGVGLASVQRILQRHGGRIWAEAQPGKGATFYFTVGNQT